MVLKWNNTTMDQKSKRGLELEFISSYYSKRHWENTDEIHKWRILYGFHIITRGWIL